MKPFKVNRNSWHYKVNKKLFNTYGDNDFYMQRRWEPEHSNFCAYWRATVFRIIFGVLTAILFTVLAAALATLIWMKPVQFGLALGFISLIFIIPIVILVITQSLKAIKDKNPDSIIVAKYLSYKNKVCSSVEFDE